MPTYYAVTDAYGPISVRLQATTDDEAVRELAGADGATQRGWVDDPRNDAESDLGISGEGDGGRALGVAAFAEALEGAGCVEVPTVLSVAGRSQKDSSVPHGWAIWRREA